MMAYRTRLDPLMRQLYFIKYGEKVSYVTSIDGYRIIAHRTNDFAGIDAPSFEYDKNGNVSRCTINVYRKSSERPFSATVSMKEYNSGRNQWRSMPETMLAKVAEAHALRKAFPQDLSGIYTQDEMDQADNKPLVKRMTSSQLQQITKLMREKQVSKQQLRRHLIKRFNKNTFANVNEREAQMVIESIEKMVTPEPEEDPIDEFIDSPPEDDISQTERIDLDEVDRGIEEQRKLNSTDFDPVIEGEMQIT
jgi:hypothetical protein